MAKHRDPQIDERDCPDEEHPLSAGQGATPVIEMHSVAGPESTTVDPQDTAHRMLVLLLEVLRPLDAAVPSEGATREHGGEPTPHRPEEEATHPRNEPAADPTQARRQLQRLLNPTDPDGPAFQEGDDTDMPSPSLEPVDAETHQEALQTWLALSQISDRLGPGQLAAVDRQTDLQALPGEVLQAIEMHLDDDRLSSYGKVLRIGHLLLGQSFPSQ